MPGNSLLNTLKRAFQVLEAFSPSHPRMKLQDVAEETGLPKVTVLRFLRTLVELKYMMYDQKEKTYFLSPRVMSLGYTVLSAIDLREVALPVLKDLSDKTGQNVNLGILDGLEIVYVERIKKRQIMNIDLHVGSRLSAYNTSIGQVILAYMAEKELGRLIAELKREEHIRQQIGEDGEKLRAQLKVVRKRGYAINDELYVKGLRAIATPVFTHDGRVDAGINIPVFASLVSRQELLERYLPPLLEAANQISRLRGFSGKKKED